MPHSYFSSFPFSLTEAIEGLQTYMEDLQTQVEELKTAQAERNKRDQAEQRRNLGAQSVSCLKELYDLHHDRYFIRVCVIAHVLLYSANSRTTKCEELFSKRKMHGRSRRHGDLTWEF